MSILALVARISLAANLNGTENGQSEKEDKEERLTRKESR